MKVKDLEGWPPTHFQCTEDPTLPFQPKVLGGLRLESVTYIPGNGRPGDVVLSLTDSETTESCTARLKVAGSDLARRILSVLEQIRGLTLEQVGLREIPDDGG